MNRFLPLIRSIEHLTNLRSILLMVVVCFGINLSGQDCGITGFTPPDTLTLEASLGACQISSRQVLEAFMLEDCEEVQLIPSGPYTAPDNRSMVLYDKVADTFMPFVLTTTVSSITDIGGVTEDTSGQIFVTFPLGAGECTATKDMLLDQLRVPEGDVIRSQIQLIKDGGRISDFVIGDTTVIDEITCDGSVFYEDITVIFQPTAATFTGEMTFDIGFTSCQVSIADVLGRLGYDLEDCPESRFVISHKGPFGYGQHFINSITLDDHVILDNAILTVIASDCNTSDIDFGMLPVGKCALNEYDIIEQLGLLATGCSTDEIVILPAGPYESSPVVITSVAIGGEVICTDAFGVTFARDASTEETGAIICHQDLNIAMGPECSVMMNADVILANGNYCYLNYNIELSLVDAPDDIIAEGHEVEINIPGHYSLMITNPATGNSCWSEFTVEDKYIEDYRCAADTVWCYESLDLIPDDTLGGGPSFPDLGEDVTFTLSGTPRTYDVSMATLCGVAFARYEDDLAENCKDEFKQVIDRLWTLEDQFGNQDTCTQRIYVRNTTLSLVETFQVLSADCISDFESLNSSGLPDPVSSGFPMIAGGYDVGVCGTLRTTYNDTEFPLCGLGKKVVRDWVLIDWCSDQVLELTQIIRIEDKKAPVILDTLVDMSISSDPFICGGTNIDLPLPTYDDCNLDEVILEVIYETYNDAGQRIKKNNGSSLFISEIITTDIVQTFEIEYILTDPCGNEARDTMMLTISDTEPPVAVCDQFTVISVGGNGNSIVNAVTFDDLSVDNCGIAKYEARKLNGSCFMDTAYTDDLRFCCEEVGDTILVEFKVTDLAGNFNICEVQVSIQDKFRPVIICPVDKTIDCAADYNDLSITGEPTVRDNCDFLDVSYEDDNMLDQCYQGTILRTWKVVDKGGFVVTCVQEITIVEDSMFNMTQAMFPADTTIFGCNVSLEPEFTGSPMVLTTSCAMVDATYSDLFFYDVDNACVKVLREWTVIDWCQRDENNSGLWKEEQIIKLQSDVGPVFLNMARDTSYCINSTDCADIVTLTGSAIDGDACTPVDELEWSYGIYNDIGAIITSGEGNEVSAILDEGSYSIVFEAVDGCDNAALDTVRFEVVDCTSPMISCPAVQPSLVLNPEGFVALSVSDIVDITLADNCDDSTQISLSFSKDEIVDVLTYTCSDLNNGISDRFVKIYATDQSANVDSCELFVQIRDNSDNLCGGSGSDTLMVAGALATRDGVHIPGVTVTLFSEGADRSLMTDETGVFSFDGLTVGEDYTVSFEKDTEHDDGVTTLDILIAQRHILGVRTFESPYQVIASDVDNNGRVTVLDLVRLRRLVLGLDERFVANDQKSWRFVDASQIFENVKSPFPFTETIDITFMDESSLAVDFMGVKIGDVNSSNSISSLLAAETRSASVQVGVKTEGDVVHFIAREDAIVNGLQFNFDNLSDRLVEAIVPGVVELADDNYFINRKELNISWTDAYEGVMLQKGDVLFSVKVKSEVATEQVISSFMQEKSEWISEDLIGKQMEFIKVDESLTIHNQSVISNVKNHPNPFIDYTNISFSISREADLKVELLDQSGRVLMLQNRMYEEGSHVIVVDPHTFDMTPGLYVLRLSTEDAMVAHKLLYLK